MHARRTPSSRSPPPTFPARRPVSRNQPLRADHQQHCLDATDLPILATPSAFSCLCISMCMSAKQHRERCAWATSTPVPSRAARLADAGHLARGKQLLVVQHRPDHVAARHVLRAKKADHSLHLPWSRDESPDLPHCKIRKPCQVVNHSWSGFRHKHWAVTLCGQGPEPILGWASSHRMCAAQKQCKCRHFQAPRLL